MREIDEKGRITLPSDHDPAGYLYTKALIDDVSRDARYLHLPQQNLAIKSLLCIPLSVRAEVLGVMTVTSDRAAAFARDDEELLTVLGNSIVRDLENARLYQLAITDPLKPWEE